MAYFPDDIIFGGILIKLPVKSLVRFKSVSTQWSFRLSDSKFVRAHLEINQKPDCRDFIIYEKGHRTMALVRISDNKLVGSKPVLETEKMKHPLRRKEDIVGIIHCDGILCMYTIDCTFVVWNPVTKVQKVFKISKKYAHDWEAFGFGYDSTTDHDFKIVYITGKKSSGGLKIRVLRLKTGVWSYAGTECLLEVEDNYKGCKVATHFNGCLYWIITRFDNGVGGIVSFDLGSETMRYEPGLMFDDLEHCGLEVFRGSLCLARLSWEWVGDPNCEYNVPVGADWVGSYSQYRAEIWLMKEDDHNVRYWSRLVSFLCTIPMVFSTVAPRPLCFVESDEDQVLVNTFARGSFFVCNTKDGSAKIVKLSGVGIQPNAEFHVIPFVESLLSP